MMDKFWCKEFGDRRQEIIFLSLKSEINEKNIHEMLDGCLIKKYIEVPNLHHKMLNPFLSMVSKSSINY